MSFLKTLFGGKPQPAKKTRSAAKTYVTSKTDRAAVIAEAMAVYRRERAQMQKGLDEALKKLRDGAAAALKDPEELARLLTLHRAHVDMRRMMASDNKRFLVLSGMRELLGDPKSAPKAAKPGSKAGKPPPKR